MFRYRSGASQADQMRKCRKLYFNIFNFSIAVVTIYVVIVIFWSSHPSTYPTATKITEALSNLFMHNKSRGQIRDVTGFGTFSVDITKAMRKVRDKKIRIEEIDTTCRRTYLHQPPALPFHCSHLMTLAGSRGRTGNQMFQYAALLGLAHRHNYTAFIKPTFPLTRYFNLQNVANVNISGMLRLRDGKSGTYYRALETIDYKYNYALDGYFQSWRYFSEINNTIRHAYRVNDSFMELALDFMKSISRQGRPNVCVHVRRGDIHSEYAIRQGYTVAGLDYIDRAMLFFKTRLTGPQFIVLSEDKGWCYEHLNSSDTVISPFYMAPVDFAVMTLCDHMIITSGTFGWWGGWFSPGIVVYYKDYPRRNSWLATQINKQDYYPASWIGMS